jgi:hypothetical protein
MKSVVIGAHLEPGDVEPIAEALPVGGIFLSGVPVADDQPLGDRELLIRVAKVRAALLERATFVAIRYGFAAASAADAAVKCAPHLQRWKTALEEHRGDVEMTLKVIASKTVARPDRREFTSGAEYLKALHAATNAVQVDEEFRAAADALPMQERRWLHRDNASLELAMLVARGAVDEVKSAGEELKRRFPHVPFLLSGPWPLEVFADEAGQSGAME